MTNLEEELTYTLTGAATLAPEPDESFVLGVRRRQRARKRRRVAAIAGCTAVLAVVSGLAVVRLTPDRNDQETVATWTGTVPDFDAAGSPETVWPEAVHRLPAKLPNGASYQVFSVLGDDRYLVRQRPRGGAPFVFDAKGGNVTFLGNEEQARHLDSSSVNWTTAVGDQAVWFASVRGPQGTWDAEIWSARLDGAGDPRVIGTVSGHGNIPPGIGVVGDSLYWDAAGGGVYRLPLSGGTAERLPHSEGYLLFDLSPWVDTSGHAIPPDTPTPLSGELWNVESGERRSWSAPESSRNIVCDPLICAGFTTAGKQFVQRPDRSAYQELPFPEDGFNISPAVEGRFGVGTVVTSRGLRWYAWDLVTGKVGAVSAEPSQGIDRGFEQATLQWPVDQQTIYVLDLTAIR
jgi:hypothetical protein